MNVPGNYEEEGVIKRHVLRGANTLVAPLRKGIHHSTMLVIWARGACESDLQGLRGPDTKVKVKVKVKVPF